MKQIGFNSKEYRVSEMSKYIILACKAKKVTYKMLAEEMHITPAAMSKKLKKNQYSLDDLLVIFKMLATTDDEILELMKV